MVEEKHNTTLESLSPDLVEEPIVISTSDPGNFVAFFTGAPAGLAMQSKAPLKIAFAGFETTNV